MAPGKRLPTLEMPEDEPPPPAPVAVRAVVPPEPAAVVDEPPRRALASIPLPPIPPARKREIMVQLSIKAPYKLVERLEKMNQDTGAQKQAIMAAALEAYLEGHGY